MVKLINIDEFCKDLPEITTTKIVRKRKFHEDGLFSEFIFGPLKNYTCNCGIYHGVSRSGGECSDCHMEITNSDERRNRFAKIVLPVPVINPIFFDMFMSVAKNKVKEFANELIQNDKSIIYFDEKTNDFIIHNKEDLHLDDVKYYEGLDAMQFFFEGYAKMELENSPDHPGWIKINENLDKIFIQNILVLPPDLRPASRGIDKDSRISDKINSIYSKILDIKSTLGSTTFDIFKNKVLFYQYFKQTQANVNELYDYILSKLAKKEGLIRGNILGKRIDFSGRGVIVSDDTITLDECVLPYLMVLEIFKIKIAKKIIESSLKKTINSAFIFIDACIRTNSPILFDLCKKIVADEYCILNRQPTLHRLGLLGFKLRVSLDKVIKIHPLVCEGFNADFDGDTMAVYIPVTEESKLEVKEKLLASKNLVNPGNGSLSMIPNQDIVYGIYILSLGIVEGSDKKIDFRDEVELLKYKEDDRKRINKFKGKILTHGLIQINMCFPDDYPVITGTIDKKRLLVILGDIQKNYSAEETTKTLDLIKLLGFRASTFYGETISLFNCMVPGVEKIKDDIYNNDDIQTQLMKVNSNEIKTYLKENFKYADIIESGARGSWDQVRQMVFSRGFISNFEGKILPTPIKNSLIHGLTPKEFFNSTYGCRKGLLDVALNTGVSGYLSRKLIFTCVNLELDDQVEDCGTNDMLIVFVDNEKKSRMLVGKYFKSSLEEENLKVFSENDVKKYINKNIYVRSPIYCKNPKVCKTCYGKFHEKLHSNYIGVIAAQSLGEANTQLVLRTFHTSGVAIVKEGQSNKDSFIQQDIVADLSSVSKKLHKFPKDTTPDKLISDLFKIYNSSRTINHVHFECVVTQLMWSGNYKWRLLKNRDDVSYSFYSIQTVPSLESWLLGFAFSNPKKHLLKGIIHSGQYKGIMDKILLGNKL